jgi:hypothetical protein
MRVAIADGSSDAIEWTRDSAGRFLRTRDELRVLVDRVFAPVPSGQLLTTIRAAREESLLGLIPEIEDVAGVFQALADDTDGYARAAEDFIDGVGIDEAYAQQGDEPATSLDDLKRELGLD